MQGKKILTVFKVTMIVLLAVILVLWAVFFIGRYGWKLGGFRSCQIAGIESVEVTDGAVRIRGYDPNLFPRGCLGYYAEEEDGTLYVGFKFSRVFGIFETGDFDFTIPVSGEIQEIVMKGSDSQRIIWPEQSE